MSLRARRLQQTLVVCPGCGRTLSWKHLSSHLSGFHGLGARERSLVAARLRPWATT